MAASGSGCTAVTAACAAAAAAAAAGRLLAAASVKRIQHLRVPGGVQSRNVIVNIENRNIYTLQKNKL